MIDFAMQLKYPEFDTELCSVLQKPLKRFVIQPRIRQWCWFLEPEYSDLSARDFGHSLARLGRDILLYLEQNQPFPFVVKSGNLPNSLVVEGRLMVPSENHLTSLRGRIEEDSQGLVVSWIQWRFFRRPPLIPSIGKVGFDYKRSQILHLLESGYCVAAVKIAVCHRLYLTTETVNRASIHQGSVALIYTRDEYMLTPEDNDLVHLRAQGIREHVINV